MATASVEPSLVDLLAIRFSEDFGLRPRHRRRRELTRARVIRLGQLSSPRCGRHRVSARSRRTEPENRPDGQDHQSDGPAGDRPEFLDRKGRTRRHLHLSPDRSLRGGHLSPARSDGGRRLTRSLRLSWDCIPGAGPSYPLRTGIATAPSRRRRSISLGRGVAGIPPRWDLLGVTSARTGDWRLANRQIRSAFGTLCVFPGVPILRLERPPAGSRLLVSWITLLGAIGIMHPPSSWELDCNRTWLYEWLHSLSLAIKNRARTQECRFSEKVIEPARC